MVVGGRDVFVIQPKGSEKSDFSVRSDILRHREAEMCEVDRPCNFSSGFAYVRPCSLYKISRDKCRDHWRRTKLRTGQKTCRKKIYLLKSTSPQLLLSQCE